ncbi:hypothetical protein ACWOAQ_00210 [Helcococcus kunzii]
MKRKIILLSLILLLIPGAAFARSTEKEKIETKYSSIFPPIQVPHQIAVKYSSYSAAASAPKRIIRYNTAYYKKKIQYIGGTEYVALYYGPNDY